jgi:hypothetical protein
MSQGAIRSRLVRYRHDSREGNKRENEHDRDILHGVPPARGSRRWHHHTILLGIALEKIEV